MKDTTEREPIIEFRDFGFQYNAQAEPTLKGIDLQIRKGEKVLIAGPSGCGKSTLAHCINGLIPFAYRGTITGSVTVRGRETQDLSIFALSRTVGTVLQDSDGQFIGLTVAEDIAFALENDCVQEPELHDRVLRAAGAVGIDSHLLNAPDQLSGGQKQRVAMAGVMVDDVEVFLFDEPLANLDPATGKSAMELIDEIHDRTGAAVIIIEHRLEDVLHRSMDRIVLMNEGRIIADTDPDTLLSGELLRSHGIREPLYVTALKYAGVRVTPELKPSSIRSLRLGPEEKQKVLDWYRRTPPSPAPPPRPVLLKAEDVTFSYDGRRETLSHISLEIFRGESLAIVGTNGAGKSTFSKVVCGFEKPQSGTLCFTGLDWPSLSLKERADHVGYVMQNPNQMISKPMIFDEVAMGLRNRNVPEEEIRPRVEQALKTCGLWPFRNWPVSALSFGQKKRVTIASILVLEPEIIILDEPTAGQDYRHYTEIMEFLRELNARGVTVVMITHDMHLMLEYADRSVVFSQGRVIADDSSAAILTDPDLVRRASLKETSLYGLALLCGIDEPKEFVRRFIDFEREAYRS
ncbi:MAG: ABC transporter ATP-binding protein [Oscillospiraceae bacterium]|nr:ABC transporter ATP-binding protein [Oscillospiraceae bacterium]